MNLCFVGCGAIAAVHADICRRLGHTLHTAVGRTPESAAEFAREWQMQHHTDRLAEALARTDIDAVLICSPSEAHEAQARSAIEAGRHVLVELPLAMSYAGGAGLAALTERRGVTVMVAHTQRLRARGPRGARRDRDRTAPRAPHHRALPVLPPT